MNLKKLLNVANVLIEDSEKEETKLPKISAKEMLVIGLLGAAAAIATYKPKKD